MVAARKRDVASAVEEVKGSVAASNRCYAARRVAGDALNPDAERLFDAAIYMSTKRLSHVVAFDDCPFTPRQRGDVPIVGAVYSGLRLEGVLVGRVRRDGADATRRLLALIADSKFGVQLQLILLQGIALAGFNVIDVHALREHSGLPVMVVARRPPRMQRIRDALLKNVPGGRRKWRLIERLGPMQPVGKVYVQALGLSLAQASDVIARLAVHGNVPEPLRTAHLIAGALATGQSRGRV